MSNVFDNTLTPSGEFVCRGIQSRPAIGYLSQLEAMRYCEVGGYYKTPRFPIWVVGSTSHFTVMFGDAACLKETTSDVLLEKCRRAFKSIDGGEENGFIPTNKLGQFFKSLELDLPDHGVQALSATIEVHGAGIILWDDLWKHTSRLMTGASLENVLQLTDTQGGSNDDEPPPLLLTQFGESEDLDRKPSASGSTLQHRSQVDNDEEIAKRLSEEWQGESHAVAASASTTAVSPMDFESTLSDEELARRLQEEWNSELSGAGTSSNSVTAVRGSPSSWRSFADDTNTISSTDSIPSSTLVSHPNSSNSNGPNKQEFKKAGITFQLYHYNGLRGGVLKPFRVTRFSAEEAVGASTSLTGNVASSATHGSGDLEDVIRTKWPSCTIDWLGAPPPTID